MEGCRGEERKVKEVRNKERWKGTWMEGGVKGRRIKEKGRK